MKLKNNMFSYYMEWNGYEFGEDNCDEEIDLDETVNHYTYPGYDQDNYLTLRLPFYIGNPHSFRTKDSREIQKKIAEMLNIPLIKKYDYESSNYYNRDIIFDSFNITYCSKSNTIENQDGMTSIQKLDGVDYRMTSDIKEYFIIDVRYIFTNGIDANKRYIISEDNVEDKKFYKHLLSKTHETVVAPVINSLRGFKGYDKRYGKPDPSGDDKWWEAKKIK